MWIFIESVRQTKKSKDLVWILIFLPERASHVAVFLLINTYLILIWYLFWLPERATHAAVFFAGYEFSWMCAMGGGEQGTCLYILCTRWRIYTFELQVGLSSALCFTYEELLKFEEFRLTTITQHSASVTICCLHSNELHISMERQTGEHTATARIPKISSVPGSQRFWYLWFGFSIWLTVWGLWRLQSPLSTHLITNFNHSFQSCDDGDSVHNLTLAWIYSCTVTNQHSIHPIQSCDNLLPNRALTWHCACSGSNRPSDKITR